MEFQTIFEFPNNTIENERVQNIKHKVMEKIMETFINDHNKFIVPIL